MLMSEYGMDRMYVIWDLPIVTGIRLTKAIARRFGDKDADHDPSTLWEIAAMHDRLEAQHGSGSST